MSNLIFLSESSILKYLEHQQSDLAIHLPVLGKVYVELNKLTFHQDKLTFPIHHNIPLISDFEIDFENFKCEGTKLSLEIGRVGIIPGFGLDILANALADYLQNIFGRSDVEVIENRIFIEMRDLVPGAFRAITVLSLQITSGENAGIRIEFDF